MEKTGVPITIGKPSNARSLMVKHFLPSKENFDFMFDLFLLTVVDFQGVTRLKTGQTILKKLQLHFIVTKLILAPDAQFPAAILQPLHKFKHIRAVNREIPRLIYNIFTIGMGDPHRLKLEQFRNLLERNITV